MTMKKLIAFSVLIQVFIIGGAAARDPESIDTGAWAEDFAQLKREMSSHYANFQWAVEHRHLNLRELSERIETELRSAQSETAARKAIESFLDTFGDGHLWVEWPSGVNSQTSRPKADTTQLPLRTRLGYHEQNIKPGIAFAYLPSYQNLASPDSKYFPIGILHLPHNANVGVLRIALFTEHIFPELCDSSLRELRLTNDSDCRNDCEDRVERMTADLLTAALERQLRILRISKITGLMVDITGNGGGTNWVEPAARVMTPKPLLSPKTEFIRHKHWVKQLKTELQTLLDDSGKGPPLLKKSLSNATRIVQRAISQAEAPCDLSVMWEDQKPSCSLVVADPVMYPDCILPYAKPGIFPDRPSSFLLFYPSRYIYHEGVYAGPLLILVDHNTASSAEYFAAMLRDNDAATIIGEPTLGAGGGFTNGGISTILKNSGGRVRMPDCVRLRADGTNEAEGITPDILIPWHRSDNDYLRAERVFHLLSTSCQLLLDR